MSGQEYYQNPLIERYASKDMLSLFSADKKFSTWRKLWVALAKAEKELGLNITDEQIAKMEANVDNIDYERAKEYEKKFRHDVMAHVHTFGDCVPEAKGIIHLGATSAFVGDNADLIIYDEALHLVKKELVNVIAVLTDFAMQYRTLPTLGFTHFQPAQLTTVGKRACLWLTDLMLDYEELEFVLGSMRLRGAKGTTGTQASFMELFDNDEEKVKQVNLNVLKEMGYDKDFPATGQTYTRKFDNRIMNLLSSIGQSMHKFATDMRLLQSMKEIEEPFEQNQIGSSAMAYKRNPMRCERICSLSRYMIASVQNTAMTASVQWFERTLDDSANRRISIPESFLCCDAVLSIAYNVIKGLQVNDKVIHKNIMAELPFMTTENILMSAVKKGGDRQELHEKIRQYSMIAAKRVKEEGLENNLLELIAQDPSFGVDANELLDILKPEKYIGRSANLTKEFIESDVMPILKKNSNLIGIDVDLKV